jgi:putative transposase
MKAVTLDFSRPGKPTDNAFIESFNGKFRAECLNAHWFMSLEDAVGKCEAWRREYNAVRPHSAIGQQAADNAGKPVSGTRPAVARNSWMTASRVVQDGGARQKAAGL